MMVAKWTILFFFFFKAWLEKASSSRCLGVVSFISVFPVASSMLDAFLKNDEGRKESQGGRNGKMRSDATYKEKLQRT